MTHIWHGTSTNVYLRITLTQPVKHVCFVSFIKNKLILLKLYIWSRIKASHRWISALPLALALCALYVSGQYHHITNCIRRHQRISSLSFSWTIGAVALERISTYKPPRHSHPHYIKSNKVTELCVLAFSYVRHLNTSIPQTRVCIINETLFHNTRVYIINECIIKKHY